MTERQKERRTALAATVCGGLVLLVTLCAFAVQPAQLIGTNRVDVAAAQSGEWVELTLAPFPVDDPAVPIIIRSALITRAYQVNVEGQIVTRVWMVEGDELRRVDVLETVAEVRAALEN